MTEGPGLSVDTFPRLLLHNARVRPHKPAIREKSLGIWQTWTWGQVAEEVSAIAAGLSQLGFKRGDTLAVVGDNRPRLYWTICAVQCLGGVPVPIYQDAVAQEVAYILEHAEIKFAVVENQEQVDKLLEIKDRCPQLQRVLYDDARGMRHYQQQLLGSLDEVQAAGRSHRQENPGFLDSEIAQAKAQDVAVILYTSGTTGNPKGVMLTHQGLLTTAKSGAQLDKLEDTDEIVSYLPMAWCGDHIFSYAQSYVTGFCSNCPESSDTVMTDTREIGPTYFFAPPRVLENLLTQVSIRMGDASFLKRKVFDYFMGVARRVGARLLDRKPGVPLIDRLLYAIGNVLVYGPLKNVLGLSRVRVGYTAGDAVGPEMFLFYRALGINLKQLYGQTEASVFVTLQPDGQVRADTVGPPAPGVELKIAESGEVLYRSPGTFICYHKNPEATAQARTADGWVHTGDAGFLDADGHLKIIDRLKDVGKLADGTLFAPKYIENKLKFSPYIKEAVVFGDKRDRVCAFINIDVEAVGNWAERQHLAYSGYADLACRPEVYQLLRNCVEGINADLVREEKLAGSQIHRFLILHKELDADDGELTRTRKVRRGFIAEKYQTLIDALYSERESCSIQTQVKFEDGRTGVIGAEVKIANARVLPTTKQIGKAA